MTLKNWGIIFFFTIVFALVVYNNFFGDKEVEIESIPPSMHGSWVEISEDIEIGIAKPNRLRIFSNRIIIYRWDSDYLEQHVKVIKPLKIEKKSSTIILNNDPEIYYFSIQIGILNIDEWVSSGISYSNEKHGKIYHFGRFKRIK